MVIIPTQMTARTIAHYNLLDKIGEGGLGEVFRARDTRVGRTVALKLVPAARRWASSPRPSWRMRPRGRLISHPNIATLFDVGRCRRHRYLAYEFATGPLLRAAMSSGPMIRAAPSNSRSRSPTRWPTQAAGIVHGDVRPDNDRGHSKGAAKLLDTGMSQWTRGGTVRRVAAAIPRSSVPRRCRSSATCPRNRPSALTGMLAPTSSRSRTLYEMLTGKNPFIAPGPKIVVNIMQPRPRRSPRSGATCPRIWIILSARSPKTSMSGSKARRAFAAALTSARFATCDRAMRSRRMITIDDEGSGAKWIAISVTLAAVGAAVWYYPALNDRREGWKLAVNDAL